MDMSHPCFVNEVTEPMRVISTGAGVPEDESSAAEVHQFSTFEQIQSHFSRNEILEQPYHFMYVLSELSLRGRYRTDAGQLDRCASFSLGSRYN